VASGIGKPGLIAAVREVKKNRLRSDRKANAREHCPAAERRERVDRAASRVESEERAAREHDCVDRLHRHFGFEQRGVAPAWRPALDGRRNSRFAVEHHDRDTARRARILGVADAQSGDVGDQVQAVGHRSSPEK
jgi:hypothetical protein